MPKSVLYFNATTEEHGAELYYLPRGGTRATLIDLVPGPDGSNPTGFITLKDQIYFSAYAPGHGYELYRLSPGSSKPTLI
jgi:ELWxxDGT repeat protein